MVLGPFCHINSPDLQFFAPKKDWGKQTFALKKVYYKEMHSKVIKLYITGFPSIIIY